MLCTNSCTSSFPGRHLIKFADDTSLLSLLKGDRQEHVSGLNKFITWGEDSSEYLQDERNVLWLQKKKKSIDTLGLRLEVCTGVSSENRCCTISHPHWPTTHKITCRTCSFPQYQCKKSTMSPLLAPPLFYCTYSIYSRAPIILLLTVASLHVHR